VTLTQLEMSADRRFPLSGHPEFSIIEYPGYREYRVAHPRTVKQDGKRPQNIASSFTTHAFLVPLLSFYWQSIPRNYSYPTLAILLVLIVRSIFSQLLYESVILLPPHGIQLESHRGMTGMRPLFSKRRFIPATSLQDVVINEGLKGWNVLYYLVVVRHSNGRHCALEVAYEDILPCHSVLLEVFEGVHECILSDPTSPSALEQLP